MSWHVLDIVTIEATLINTQIKSKISNVTIFYTPCMRCNTQPCTKTAHLTSHSAALLSLSPYFTLFSRHYLCLQNKSDPILTRSGPRMALLLLLHQLCFILLSQVALVLIHHWDSGISMSLTVCFVMSAGCVNDGAPLALNGSWRAPC